MKQRAPKIDIAPDTICPKFNDLLSMFWQIFVCSAKSAKENNKTTANNYLISRKKVLRSLFVWALALVFRILRLLCTYWVSFRSNLMQFDLVTRPEQFNMFRATSPVFVQTQISALFVHTSFYYIPIYFSMDASKLRLQYDYLWGWYFILCQNATVVLHPKYV